MTSHQQPRRDDAGIPDSGSRRTSQRSKALETPSNPVSTETPKAVTPAPLAPGEARAEMQQLQQEMNRLQRTIRLSIQQQLSKWSGQSLGSLELNQELAVSIHQLLEGHGLRVRCCECGHPAILRVSARGSGNGVFVFDHSIDGRRTFHGGRSTVPKIALVAKPPRKKKAG